MDVMSDKAKRNGAHPAQARPRRTAVSQPPDRVPATLPPWLRAQSVNVTRHAAALRPFRRDEFGTGDASPSEGHIQAANALIKSLRDELLKHTKEVTSGV